MEEKNVQEEMQEEVKEETSEKKNKKEKKDAIKQLQEEINEWKDKYYRLFADMDNLRKQYQKDYASMIKYQSQTIVEKLLPSIDIFAMVIGSADKLPDEVRNYVMGFDAVYRQMLQALESEGVVEIPCKVGDQFNHEIHFAMDTVEVEDEAQVDTIMKVYKQGYKLYDRLLRASTVCVGVKKIEKKEKNEPEAQA